MLAHDLIVQHVHLDSDIVAFLVWAELAVEILLALQHVDAVEGLNLGFLYFSLLRFILIGHRFLKCWTRIGFNGFLAWLKNCFSRHYHFTI